MLGSGSSSALWLSPQRCWSGMAHHHLWRGHGSTNMNILIANTPKIYNVEYIQVLNMSVYNEYYYSIIITIIPKSDQSSYLTYPVLLSYQRNTVLSFDLPCTPPHFVQLGIEQCWFFRSLGWLRSNLEQNHLQWCHRWFVQMVWTER